MSGDFGVKSARELHPADAGAPAYLTYLRVADDSPGGCRCSQAHFSAPKRAEDARESGSRTLNHPCAFATCRIHLLGLPYLPPMPRRIGH